jgi:hypothetical protein
MCGGVSARGSQGAGEARRTGVAVARARQSVRSDSEDEEHEKQTRPEAADDGDRVAKVRRGSSPLSPVRPLDDLLDHSCWTMQSQCHRYDVPSSGCIGEVNGGR